MTKLFYFLVATFVAVILVGTFIAIHRPASSPARFGFAPSPTATTTNASTTIGTTTVGTILTANPSAIERSISNPGPGVLYLWLNSTSTGFSGASGVSVYPSTTYVMTEQLGNMWLGNIFGLMSNASTVISYHEQ